MAKLHKVESRTKCAGIFFMPRQGKLRCITTKKMYLCNNEGLHLAHLTAFSTMNKHVRAQSVETQYIASKRHTQIFMTLLVGDVMYHVPTMLNSLFVMI